MASSEQRISGLLRAILTDLACGADIPNSKEFRMVLGCLELYLPAVLAEIYPEWKHESLDGVLPLVARKTGKDEVELFGLCIIISDQTTTPILVRLQVAPDSDELSWIVCRLGEAGEHGMARAKLRSVEATDKRLHALEGRAKEIDWVYRVTFGQRRP